MKTKLQILITLLMMSIRAFAAGADTIILPLEFSAQGFPVASVQIQGHKIPLIFDNGATKSSIVLSKELVKKLDLKIIPAHKKTCFHDVNGKKTCSKVYTIPELKIGQMIMHDVPCELMDKLWFKAKNGIIGLDLLHQFNVLIDYKASQIILTKLGEYPQQYNIKKWTQIPFSNKYGITTIAKINGTNVTLVWDTGANGSIMKSTVKIPTEKKSCAYKENPSCQYFETITFMVGNKPLPKTRFTIQKIEVPFDGLIGSDFFKEHRVFIDFKNNILFVENSNSAH